MRGWTRRPALLAAGILLAGCEMSPAASPVERIDSAGVEIVMNPGPDHQLDWRLEPEFSLGGQEEGEETFYTVNAVTVGVDSLGRIHVLDPDNSRIQVFDTDGGFLRTLGRPGEGPGELSRPLAFAVGPGGEVYVNDMGRQGLLRWAGDGELMEALELPFPFFGGRIVGVPGGIVLAATPPGSGLGTQVLFRVDQAGDTTFLARHSVPTPEGGMQLESCGMGLPAMPPVFAPGLRWDAAGERVALARGTGYDVEVRSDGLHRRVRRDLAPRPATPELALESVGAGLRVRIPGGVRVCDPEEVVEKRGHAEVIPAVGGLRLAPDGSLWVARHSLAEDDRPPIDVFDAGGAYLGTLPEGTPLPLGFLPDGRALTAERDELDVERLVVSRVVRSEGD